MKQFLTLFGSVLIVIIMTIVATPLLILATWQWGLLGFGVIAAVVIIFALTVDKPQLDFIALSLSLISGVWVGLAISGLAGGFFFGIIYSFIRCDIITSTGVGSSSLLIILFGWFGAAAAAACWLLVPVYLFAFNKSIVKSTPLTEEEQITTHAKLYRALSYVSQQTGIAIPRVRIGKELPFGVASFGYRILLVPDSYMQFTDEELRAILAHEWGHFSRGSFPRILGVASILEGPFAATYLLLLLPTLNGLLISLMLGLVVPMMVFLLWRAYMRREEYRADVYSAKLTSATVFMDAIVRFLVIAKLPKGSAVSQALHNFRDVHPSIQKRAKHLGVPYTALPSPIKLKKKSPALRSQPTSTFFDEGASQHES